MTGFNAIIASCHLVTEKLRKGRIAIRWHCNPQPRLCEQHKPRILYQQCLEASQHISCRPDHVSMRLLDENWTGTEPRTKKSHFCPNAKTVGRFYPITH